MRSFLYEDSVSGQSQLNDNPNIVRQLSTDRQKKLKKWPLLGSLRDTIPHCDQIIIQTKSSGGKQVQVTTDIYIYI